MVFFAQEKKEISENEEENKTNSEAKKLQTLKNAIGRIKHHVDAIKKERLDSENLKKYRGEECKKYAETVIRKKLMRQNLNREARRAVNSFTNTPSAPLDRGLSKKYTKKVLPIARISSAGINTRVGSKPLVSVRQAGARLSIIRKSISKSDKSVLTNLESILKELSSIEKSLLNDKNEYAEFMRNKIRMRGLIKKMEDVFKEGVKALNAGCGTTLDASWVSWLGGIAKLNCGDFVPGSVCYKLCSALATLQLELDKLKERKVYEVYKEGLPKFDFDYISTLMSTLRDTAPLISVRKLVETNCKMLKEIIFAQGIFHRLSKEKRAEVYLLTVEEILKLANTERNIFFNEKDVCNGMKVKDFIEKYPFVSKSFTEGTATTKKVSDEVRYMLKILNSFKVLVDTLLPDDPRTNKYYSIYNRLTNPDGTERDFVSVNIGIPSNYELKDILKDSCLNIYLDNCKEARDSEICNFFKKLGLEFSAQEAGSYDVKGVPSLNTVSAELLNKYKNNYTTLMEARNRFYKLYREFMSAWDATDMARMKTLFEQFRKENSEELELSRSIKTIEETLLEMYNELYLKYKTFLGALKEIKLLEDREINTDSGFGKCAFKLAKIQTAQLEQFKKLTKESLKDIKELESDILAGRSIVYRKTIEHVKLIDLKSILKDEFGYVLEILYGWLQSSVLNVSNTSWQGEGSIFRRDFCYYLGGENLYASFDDYFRGLNGAGFLYNLYKLYSGHLRCLGFYNGTMSKAYKDIIEALENEYDHKDYIIFPKNKVIKIVPLNFIPLVEKFLKCLSTDGEFTDVCKDIKEDEIPGFMNVSYHILKKCKAGNKEARNVLGRGFCTTDYNFNENTHNIFKKSLEFLNILLELKEVKNLGRPTPVTDEQKLKYFENIIKGYLPDKPSLKNIKDIVKGLLYLSLWPEAQRTDGIRNLVENYSDFFSKPISALLNKFVNNELLFAQFLPVLDYLISDTDVSCTEYKKSYDELKQKQNINGLVSSNLEDALSQSFLSLRFTDQENLVMLNKETALKFLFALKNAIEKEKAQPNSMYSKLLQKGKVCTHEIDFWSYSPGYSPGTFGTFPSVELPSCLQPDKYGRAKLRVRFSYKRIPEILSFFILTSMEFINKKPEGENWLKFLVSNQGIKGYCKDYENVSNMDEYVLECDGSSKPIVIKIGTSGIDEICSIEFISLLPKECSNFDIERIIRLFHCSSSNYYPIKMYNLYNLINALFFKHYNNPANANIKVDNGNVETAHFVPESIGISIVRSILLEMESNMDKAINSRFGEEAKNICK